ncbi:MAG: RNA 2',3'-cyclic phosphodiesterase [Burkholderiales bacterium]|nr:RNA 2',3'-cyclic phosphodiesterase [Burkholderiales bacterium]
MRERAPEGGRSQAAGKAGLRLFFALWPDDAVRDALAAWARELHRACGGRTTRPQNLHVTLAFLGDTDGGRLPELKAAAGSVAPRAFELVLDRPGYWKHNRIAWAGASETPEALQAMVVDLRAALGAAGFRFDEKPFVSHVTLLRKGNSPRALPRLDPIVWRGCGFTLIRSVPGAEGSDYAVEAEWRAAEG